MGDKRVSPSPDPRPAKATSTKKKPVERDPSPQPPQKDPVQDDTRERDASPVRREASRSTSRPDIRRRGKPEAKEKPQNDVRVRIENLPPDITEEELKDIGSDWGKVDHARVWSFGGKTYGNLLYSNVDDAMKALVHLYGRRIAGCEQKLKAQIPCPSCDHLLWE